MRRIAIYARYSTDKQDSRSCEDQARRCRALAEARGFAVVREYADAAVSGSHTERAELQKLIGDAKRRTFESVLVDDLSRLSRDLGGTWKIVYQDMAAAGVNVIDCTTGISSDAKGARLTFGALALVNDTFLELVRTETHRGLEGRALSGFATGGRTYGFGTVTEPNPPDVEHPRKLRVVHEDEAKVVRRMFEMAAEGLGCKAIAATLNAEGIRAPHDGGRGNKRARGWGHTTIRHMLRNENYVGVFVWNRHKFQQIPGTNSYRHVPRPESEWVKTTLPDLRIVSADSWARVQREIGPKRTRQTAAIGTGRKPGNLLAGLVKCGVCGGAVSVVSRRYKKGVGYTALGCGTHHSRGETICANGRTISAGKLAAAVVGALQERLQAPGLVERFIAGVKKRFTAPKPSRLVELENLLLASEERMENLADAIAQLRTSAALTTRLQQEEALHAKLTSEAEGLRRDQQPKVLPHPKVIENLLSNLLSLLARDPDRARTILKRFMPPVVLTPHDGDGWQISGGFDLEATLDQGSAVREVGGTGIEPATRAV